MTSRFLRVALVIAIVSASACAQLRVCADPDNMPFSNRAQQGFENRIASLLAASLHQKLEYEWQRMGRGFVRDVLNKNKCDVLLGIPQDFHPVLTTAPYYRSTYVFVIRRSAGVHLTSFDDPHLAKMKVGVQVLGEDYAPPAQALGRRGLVSNIKGFDSTGSAASSIIDAVAQGRIGAAVVWGPFAGYFSRKYHGALEITPTPASDTPSLPLTYAISMGVRKSDVALRNKLNDFIGQHQSQIARILRSYGVPVVPLEANVAIARRLN